MFTCPWFCPHSQSNSTRKVEYWPNGQKNWLFFSYSAVIFGLFIPGLFSSFGDYNFLFGFSLNTIFSFINFWRKYSEVRDVTRPLLANKDFFSIAPLAFCVLKTKLLMIQNECTMTPQASDLGRNRLFIFFLRRKLLEVWHSKNRMQAENTSHSHGIFGKTDIFWGIWQNGPNSFLFQFENSQMLMFKLPIAILSLSFKCNLTFVVKGWPLRQGQWQLIISERLYKQRKTDYSSKCFATIFNSNCFDNS